MTFPDDVPVLTDGVVTLRAHREDDIEAICEQCRDPVSRQFTRLPVPYTREEARSFVESRPHGWENGTGWTFAIESQWGAGASRYSGSIGLHAMGSRIATIGFGLHPQARGHGVMSRAVDLAADWAFAEQDLHTIVWEAYEGNVASRRVAWRTGFTFEGATRASIPHRQDPRDGWRATLLCTDSREPKTRWLEPVTLEGDQVRLRELRPDDECRYLETVLDPETSLWLGSIPFPRDAEHFHRHLARRSVSRSLGEAIEWTIADLDDDRYVGTLSLFGLTGLDYKSGEVGYRTHPDSRGKGVLKEAMRIGLAHAFAPADEGGVGLERVSLNAGVGNHGSLGVARSCGFTETGRDRRCYDLDDGSIVDLVRFDLLRDEFYRER